MIIHVGALELLDDRKSRAARKRIIKAKKALFARKAQERRVTAPSNQLAPEPARKRGLVACMGISKSGLSAAHSG